jgi:integrase
MKANREHRVPLSSAVLALLAALPRLADSEALFPSPRGKFLSDMALAALLRRMNEADAGRWVDPKAGRPVVTHGFRSTFRDWAAERTAYPRELAEVALAHSVADKTEAAYWRGDLLAKRMRMMEDWAAFIARVESTAAVVVPIRAA